MEAHWQYTNEGNVLNPICPIPTAIIQFTQDSSEKKDIRYQVKKIIITSFKYTIKGNQPKVNDFPFS